MISKEDEKTFKAWVRYWRDGDERDGVPVSQHMRTVLEDSGIDGARSYLNTIMSSRGKLKQLFQAAIIGYTYAEETIITPRNTLAAFQRISKALEAPDEEGRPLSVRIVAAVEGESSTGISKHHLMQLVVSSRAVSFTIRDSLAVMTLMDGSMLVDETCTEDWKAYKV
jgi:hypothetical protein